MVSLPVRSPGGTRLESHEKARTHASRKTQQPRKGENYGIRPRPESSKDAGGVGTYTVPSSSQAQHTDSQLIDVHVWHWGIRPAVFGPLRRRPRNRQRGPAPHTGHRRRDVHRCCLLDSGYAPTPCRGVRVTGQTPEPTKAHAQSDTGPDIADHAPASGTSHAGPTLSSARQGGCCFGRGKGPMR